MNKTTAFTAAAAGVVAALLSGCWSSSDEGADLSAQARAAAIARGCDLAIATGAPIENLRFYWDLFSLGTWFDMSRAVYDDGRLSGKPDPAIYRAAAERIGRAPGECCVFEDAVAGLKSAVGAGIGSVVMIDSTVDAEELKRMPGVSLVIRDFTDTDALLRLVKG